MRQAERILKVQEFFARQEFVDFEQLCRHFGASKSSIRRDLLELEQKGIVRRVHGGAISLKLRDESVDYGRLSGSSQDEKFRIGKLAASLVTDGQTIILGGGSTTVEVAKNLTNRPPIQVITNSIPVVQVFWDSKQVEVTLTGGYFYPRLGVQLGPICERMLNSVSADMLIMGIRGISAVGISDHNTLIVESLRAMIKAARKVVLVADHSKFGIDGMVHVASLDDVDQIVSDSALDPKFHQMLKEHEIELLLA
jgi:DeoR/GlpR family transcriptional regulator of sugar metabolism